MKEPSRRGVIRSKWISTMRNNNVNNGLKYKARLVVAGHSQIKQKYYEKVLKPGDY